LCWGGEFAPIIIPHVRKKDKRESGGKAVFFEKKPIFPLFFVFCIKNRLFREVEKIRGQRFGNKP
jgi:hypothetical protein